MNWKEFKVTVPGKWVLAGEHTVLRGGQAIALPHPNFNLTLHYIPGMEPLKVLPEVTALILHDVMRLASEWLQERGVAFDWPRGILHVESTIPYGAGLGSSAALTVALARWLLKASSRPEADEHVIEFARFLENRFHGRSSGMDVTTVVFAEPILFSMKEGGRPLNLRRIPFFQFHDSGLRASTRECVSTVEALSKSDPTLGEKLDREMSEATELALRGLAAFAEDEQQSLDLLGRSMALSTEVFRRWGLIPGELARKLDEVITSGARGVRITGAGMGGFVVSLK